MLFLKACVPEDTKSDAFKKELQLDFDIKTLKKRQLSNFKIVNSLQDFYGYFVILTTVSM